MGCIVMRRIAVWYLSFFLSTLSLQAQSSLGLPFIKYYSSHDYNAGIQNWHITQDSRGIIYVANNFGLLEYDGSSWAIYPVADGVKVRHVNFTPDKKIAIASQGEFGYFISNQHGQLNYKSISDSLSEENRNFEETWKVFHLNGKDYFCTTTKIFIIGKEGNQVISSNEAMDSFFLVNQELYVHKPSKGLEILRDDRFIPTGNEQLLGISIASIIPLANNRLMIVTRQNGVFIMDAFNNKIWQPDQQEILSQSIINAALRLRNGDFAFGTQNNGLMVYSPTGELKNHLTKDFGLSNRTIICLFEDKQNNLWVGHNNGISYIEFGQPFSFINEHMGLPGTGYDGFQDSQSIYLATNNGLFKSDMSQGNSGNKFQIIKGSEGQVYFINKIDDNFLVGHNSGAFFFKDGSTLQEIGKMGTWLFEPLFSKPDYLIAGTYNGLELYKKNTESVTNLGRLDGFGESCRIMEQDDNTIWMTHGYKGVFRFHLSEDLKSVQEVQFYGEDRGFPSNALISVYRIRGNLCFTTLDGVYKYTPESDSFVKDPFFEKYFEPNTPLNVLTEDANQNIYFLGQSEIGVLRKDAAGDYYKVTDTFNKIKGMLNDDLQNISILENNRVLYGAKEGFIVYDATKDIPFKYDFNVLIREVTLTGNPDSTIYFGNTPNQIGDSTATRDSAACKLVSANNSLRFQYSSTFIDGLDLTTYQYFLEGFDKEWSDWEKKNEKEYTNLYEGQYTFKVRAKNLYGHISHVASYPFTISPPWYRTKFAYSSYFILFSVSLMTLIGIITQKHKKEKNIMIINQENELNKRDSELKTIKTESEKEIEKLKTEKLRADIKHKNKELATATMHLINKNEFMTQVKQNLTAIVRNNPKDKLTSDLEKIMTSIDRNITDDDDWQHFEIHFDQVHGDFSERLKTKYPNLSPQDRRLCAYLRMNMTTKEIANLLNITIRGTEISRYRLRKKLGLSRDTNLAEYILNF